MEHFVVIVGRGCDEGKRWFFFMKLELGQKSEGKVTIINYTKKAKVSIRDHLSTVLKENMY